MEKDLTLLIPSYNKAPYIERALNSLAEQTYIDRTKILVGDDCSTDDSVEIIIQCAEKYGLEMELYVNAENLGVTDNFEKLYQSIDTEFYAILCLDDYYAHPEKLERGVRFLKSHPDFSMHACNCYSQRQNGKLTYSIPMEKEDYVITAYSDMPFFQACVPVFRNFWNAEKDPIRRRQLLDYRKIFASSDPFANLMAVHYGKCYFENFFGNVYWINETDGVWNSLNNIEKDLGAADLYIKLAEIARDFFEDRDDIRHCLTLAMPGYLSAVESLFSLLRHLSAGDFKASESFMCGFADNPSNHSKSNDIKKVFDVMIDLESKIKSFGFGVEVIEQ